MRTILFKGKLVDNSEWVFGDLSRVQTPRKTAFFVNQIEVIPETVGQFTGLFDKNGTKIFEGDVLTFTRNIGCFPNTHNFTTEHTVLWDNGVARFGLSNPSAETQKFREHPHYIYEIIGNIHDK